MRFKWLNAVLIAAIFLGMMPFSAQAAPSEARFDSMIAATGTGDEPPTVTVEPGLQSLAPDDEVGYLIYLREKPDLSAAYEMDWESRGHYVVKQLQASAERSQADVRAHLDAQGVSYQAFWIDNVIVVESSPARTINQLTTFPEIASIREKREMIVYEPTVEGNQLHSPGAVEPNLTHVLADQVWDLGYRGEGLVVANIDTGVRATHEALARQYRGAATGSHDYNWLGAAGGSATPIDEHGHGTHTMGTMVGADAGGVNQIGMAPGAQWIACDGCEGTSCPDAALLTCAQWVAAPYPVGDPSNPDPTMRPHVVNNSWGDCGRSYDGWYQASVDAWLAAGIYPVFSNGNAANCSYPSPPGLNTVGNPARYGNVTGVGSTGQSNGLYAPHSNWGPTDHPDTVNPKPGWEDLKPQVLAPGVDIRSSVPGSDTAYQGGWSGTSMSAPHVAGLIALMWQAAPCLMGDYAATETIIEETATPVPYDDGTGGGATVPNQATGWGEIDALAAVDAAVATCGTAVLQGNVTDAETGLPIEGARVRALGDGDTVHTRLTDAQGDYRISLIPGTYSVDASKYGYGSETFSSVTLTEAMTTTLDIPMAALPSYTVDGTVTDAATGWPLHARVSTDQGEESWSDPVTGYYSMTLFGAHPYTLTAMSWAAGYQPSAGAVGPLTGDAQLDIDLEAALACTAPGYRLTQGVFEPFEGDAFPPPGWTVVNNGGSCVWHGDDPGNRGNLTGAEGKFAIADSDACGMGTTMNTDLLSPIVDVSNLDVVTLTFAYDYRHLSAGSAQVDISADGGGTWTNLVTWTADARGPATFSQDVAAWVAGSTEVQVRFRFVSPGWYWWWAIDDVVLGDPVCVAPTAGSLAVGHVYDANTGAPLEGARLSSADDDVVSDLSGFYSLYGVGTQDVIASLDGYADAVEGVTFADGGVVPQDFELTAGRLVASPDGLAATLTLGENAKQWLSLDNQGALDVAYRLVEIPGGHLPTGPVSEIALPRLGGERRFELALGDASGRGVAAESWLSTGSVQLTLDDGSAEDAIGLTAGGQFLWLNRFTPDPADYPFFLDQVWMLFRDTVSVGESIELVIWEDTDSDGDPGTGTTFRSAEYVTVQANDSMTWNVYTLRSPVFFAGPGDVLIGAVNRDAIGTHPAALDMTASRGRSWIGLYAGNPPEPPALPSDDDWGLIDGFGFAGNWMIRGSGVTDVGEEGLVPWLSESPVTGTVAAGTGEAVLITFDASVPEVAVPGVYYAQVRVETDTPYGANTVPVTLTVEAPDSWGKLEGVVQSLGYCDLAPTAAEAATVTVEAGTGMTWSRLTDADGMYELWLDARHSPLTLTVAYDDHVTAVTTDVVVLDGATTTVDVGLRSSEPCVRVAPDGVHVSVAMGFTATDAITISNLGAAATDFALIEFNGGMLPSSVTPIASTVPDHVITLGDGPILTRSTGTDLVPTASDSSRPAGTHMITHSISQTVLAGNSVHCSSGGIHADNSYLRVFHLPDFGIDEDFDVTNVEVGIETASNGPQPATLNLYTLDGSLTWANLTLIGSADVSVADQALTVYNIPVTAEVPAGSTLVVELFTPSGAGGSYSFLVGSNDLGQTSPTYLAAADCGVAEPADVADLGLPGMHLVMNVTGETPDPLRIPWLSGNPETGSVDADDASVVGLTFDATSAITQVTAPGDYFATLRVDTSDAQNGMIHVPVTMTVLPPESWGKVSGVVHSLGYCDAMTDTLAGAEVRIEAAGGASWILTTDAEGAYQAWIDEMYSPVTVTVSALEHEPRAAFALEVTGGAETTTDFHLRRLAPCVEVMPSGVHATLELGATATEVIALTNAGAVGTGWALTEEHLGAPTVTPPETIYHLNESFEGAFPPAGWTNIRNSGNCDWLSSALTGYPNETGGSGAFADANSDACGSGTTMDVELRTPSLDLSGTSGPRLEFRTRYRPYLSSYGHVGISIDGGTTWTNLLTYNGNIDAHHQVIDLSAYAGESNVVIRFRYVSESWDWYWQVDDVIVASVDPVIWLTETPVSGALAADTGEQVVAVDFDASVTGVDQPGDYLAHLLIDSDDPYAPARVPVTMTVTAPATWGELEGTVTSLGRCEAEPVALESADVVIWDAAAATAVVTVTTDVDGAYSYWLPTGDYTVTVTAAEHIGDAYRVTVPASGSVTRDFDLRAIVPCVAGIVPSSMEVTVAMGVSTTLPLTISNAGAGELTFSFYETNGGVLPTLRLSLQQAVQASTVVWDAQKLEGDCAVYKDSSLAEPPEAWGCYDSVPAPQTFALQPLAPTDVGYAQDIGYISDNFVGFALNDFPGQTAIGTSTNAYYGMDFDPDATTLYALNDTTGELGTIDLATGAFTGLVACPPGGGAANWTGLTIDPVAGTFYGSTATHLYTIDPMTGASTLVGPFGTSIMIDIAMSPAGEIYGHDIGTDAIYQIDPATGAATLVGATGYDANFAQGMDFDNQDGTLYVFLYQGGGANVYGTVDLTTGAVTPLAVSNPQGEFEGATQTRATGNIPWLFQDPESGVVPPMSDGVADITFDAGVVEVTQPGAYFGTLTVNNSDPVWAGHTIPVTMNVTLPETYGQITGTVMGLGPCDDPLSTTPLEGADVIAASASHTWRLSTDAEGGYVLWLDEAQGPVTLTVQAAGYISELITDVVVISGTTTVAPELLLRPDAPCFAGVTPADAHVTLAMGMSTTLPISVVNTGAGALDWTVSRADGGFVILATDTILVVNDGGTNGTAVAAFTTALDNLGYTYDVVVSSASTGIPAALTDYAAVLYAGIPTGGAEADQLIAYLDAGGRLLVADNDFGWSMGSHVLYTDYFQSTYVSDAGSDGQLTGLDIMASIDPDISADPYPDDFTVGAEGTCIFEAPSANCAGVTVDRLGYRGIYLAWDFQYSDGRQDNILDVAVPWLTGAVPWLDLDPTSGMVAPDSTATLTATFDAGVPEVTQPGDYYAALTFKGAGTEFVVPVTMTVTPPDTWGKLEGVVRGLGYCDAAPEPLEGAVVFIESAVTAGTPVSHTLTTDADGAYGIWLDEVHSPFTVTISNEASYVAQVFSGVAISGTQITALDADLRSSQPCVSFLPAEGVAVTLDMGTGASEAMTLTLVNAGPISTTFSLGEQDLGFTIAAMQPAAATDGFGYTMTDSGELLGPAFDFVDIAAFGVPLGLGDDEAVAVALPFEFDYYGTPYTDVYVSSNGLLSFGAAVTNFLNPATMPLPTLPNNIVATMWDDLRPGAAGEIFTYSFDRCPYGNGACVVVQYDAYEHADGAAAGTWQAILFRNGSILMQYADAGAKRGATSTTGMEDFAGINGLLFAANQPDALYDGLAICFAFPGRATDCVDYDVPWLELSTLSGNIAGDAEVDVTLHFDAGVPEAEQPGEYQALITFLSDDPVSPWQMVPVTMTVVRPATVGTISGDVYGWNHCDVAALPMAGALVLAESAGGTRWSTTTDAGGAFRLHIDESHSPITLTLTHDGYVNEAIADVVVVGSETTDLGDLFLRMNAPCIGVDPHAIDVTLTQGHMLTRELTLMNMGAAVLHVTDVQGEAWLRSDVTDGTVDPDDQRTLNLTLDAAGMSLGAHHGELVILSDGPMMPKLRIPVTMTVRTPTLEAEKTAEPAQDLFPGDAMTYTLVLTNTSDGPLSVVVRDAIPGNTAYAPGSTTGGLQYIEDGASRYMSWRGELAANAVKAFTFAVIVDRDYTWGEITNAATIDFAEQQISADVTVTVRSFELQVATAGRGSVTAAPDAVRYRYGDVVTLTAVPDPGWAFAGWSGDAAGTDDVTTVTMDANKVVTATFILLPDLVVSKTVTPTTDVEPGDVVTYTIELVNHGDVTAVGIVLTDTLPAGVAFDDFVVNNGAAEEEADVIRWAGDLTKDEMLSITFTVTVDVDEMPYNATITNTVAFISDNAGGGFDEASFRFRLPYRLLLLMIMKNYTP